MLSPQTYEFTAGRRCGRRQTRGGGGWVLCRAGLVAWSRAWLAKHSRRFRLVLAVDYCVRSRCDRLIPAVCRVETNTRGHRRLYVHLAGHVPTSLIGAILMPAVHPYVCVRFVSRVARAQLRIDAAAFHVSDPEAATIMFPSWCIRHGTSSTHRRCGRTAGVYASSKRK